VKKWQHQAMNGHTKWKEAEEAQQDPSQAPTPTAAGKSASEG